MLFRSGQGESFCRPSGPLLLTPGTSRPLLVPLVLPTPLHGVLSLNSSMKPCEPWGLPLLQPLIVGPTDPRSCFEDQMRSCRQKNFGNPEGKEVIFTTERNPSAPRRMQGRGFGLSPGLCYWGKCLSSPSLQFPSYSAKKVNASH